MHQPTTAPVTLSAPAVVAPPAPTHAPHRPLHMEDSPKLDVTVTIPASQSVLLAAGLQATSSFGSSLSSPPATDATYVVNGLIQSQSQSQSHHPQTPHTNSTSSSYSVPLVDKSEDNTPGYSINSGTVTKSKPSVLSLDSLGSVDSSTITKSSAAPTRDASHKVVAKRAINFDIENLPSAAGRFY